MEDKSSLQIDCARRLVYKCQHYNGPQHQYEIKVNW